MGLYPGTEQMTPLDFLSLLWQFKPEDLYVLLWTLPDKRSHWYRDIAAAAEFVLKSRGMDVYVGVGLSRADHGPTRRCASEEIAGISGFWADLDLRSDAHDKKALPTTIPDALSVIPPSMPPTIVIATGNGAHAWWLFKEPYLFDSDEDRQAIASQVVRWNTLLCLNASSRGWVYDRLSDLARILRIPGTQNLKDPANPKDVVLHSFTDRRYNLSDFEEYLDAAAIPDQQAQDKAAREWAERFADKPLVIDGDAHIPQEMLDAWMAADMRFKNTWLRQRHDLKDQSQSGYDLALANFGVEASLNEQQIVDLIIHHRRQYGQKPRTRVDYFQRAIAKASRRSPGINAPALLSGAPTPGPTTGNGAPPGANGASEAAGSRNSASPDPATAKALLCQQISQILGVPFHNPYRKSNGFWNPLRIGKKGSTASRILALLVAHPDFGDSQHRWTYGDIALWADWVASHGILKYGVKEKLPDFDRAQTATMEQLDEIFETGALTTLMDACGGDYHALLNWWRRLLTTDVRGRVQFPADVAAAWGPRALIDTPKVVVGTIHSVKGGQADVVYLFPDLSRAGDAQYQRKGAPHDTVIRTFYVGITRARETLYICQRETPVAVSI